MMSAVAAMLHAWLLTLLCATLILLPACSAADSAWLWPHRGDVRAAITLTAAELAAAAGGPIAAVVEWRRRDANPEKKAILVTTSAGDILHNVTVPVITQHMGVVVFTPEPASPGDDSAGSQTYYVYYMPYTQSGVGHVHLTWDPPGAGPSAWSPAANFSTVQKGVHSRQVFALASPATSSRFRWTCTETWGGFQGYLIELEFRTSAGWLTNHATSAQQAPITAASSWQPWLGRGGQAWAAMDGDNRTVAICIKIDEFCIKNDGFCIKNDGLCIKNDGLCIKDDEF